jgi:hypothetical protein
MATNILMVRDGTLTLGTVPVDVSCQISGGTIKATPDPKTLTTMCGKSTVPGVTAFTFDVTGAQDWAADGISTYLMDNDGTLVDFVYTPSSAIAPSASGKCWIAPGDFGGVVGEIAVFSVTLGVEGKPTITPAT